jgi:hypothetical protein
VICRLALRLRPAFEVKQMWMQSRALNRILALVVLSSAVMVASPSAKAQGYRMGLSAALPRPISSLDLTRYAAAMNLAPEQMRALGEIHERYKADFKTFAESGVIQQFTEQRKVVDGMPFDGQPTTENLNRWLASHQSATAAIAGLDARLFDELAPLLVENQQPLLQRVKVSRERVRLMGDEIVQEWFAPNGSTDVCEVFANIAPDMKRESREANDASMAALDAYQTQYVGKLRGLQEAVRDMHREWRRLLDGAGVGSTEWEQRNNHHETLQQIVGAWSEATKKVKPRANEIVQLNRATVKSVAAMLNEDDAWRFKRAFFETAYVGSAEEIREEQKMLLAAAKVEGLTQEERATIDAFHDSWRRRSEQFIERASDISDALSALERPGLSENQQELHDAQMQLSDRFQQASTATYEALTTLLGEQRKGAFSAARRALDIRDLIIRSGEVPPEDVDATVEAMLASGERSLPRATAVETDQAFARAIDGAALTHIERRCQLSDDQRAALQAVHESYVAQYHARLEQAQRAIRNLHIAFMHRTQPDGTEMASYASPEDVAKAAALEREALAALRQTDAAFLDEIARIAGDAEAASIGIIRLARDLRVLSRGGRPGSDALRCYDAYVTLLSFVDELELTGEDQTACHRLIYARADQWRAAADEHFRANRAAAHAREMHMAHAYGPKRSPPELFTARETEALEMEHVADARRAALAGVVRSALDDLCAALPMHAQALRDRYEQTAYPRVSTDRLDAGALLARALALKDVSASQRGELEAAAAKFRPAYRALCEQMIAVNREWDAATQYTEDGRKARDDAKYRWDRLLFERDELNYAARFALQRILTPAQRAAIGLRIS